MPSSSSLQAGVKSKAALHYCGLSSTVKEAELKGTNAFYSLHLHEFSPFHWTTLTFSCCLLYLTGEYSDLEVRNTIRVFLAFKASAHFSIFPVVSSDSIEFLQGRS